MIIRPLCHLLAPATQGATHGFTPCASCATTSGQFGDTVTETFNYVGNWLTSNIAS
jgi:hypothetical protein